MTAIVTPHDRAVLAELEAGPRYGFFPARFTRALKLVEAGLVDRDAPTGAFTLTDRGRAALAATPKPKLPA